MTRKEQFNAEEWDQIAQGPPLAAILVITASRGGSMRESPERGRGLHGGAREQGGAGADPAAARVTHRRSIRARQSSAEELRTQTTERLREAATLVDERATPEEADAYKKFILDVASTAALRHKEGGFLGIGGQRVSDAEAAALAEIAAALDIPYPPPEDPAGG